MRFLLGYLRSAINRQSSIHSIKLIRASRQFSAVPPTIDNAGQKASNNSVKEEDGQSLPVWSCNEWDPLREVIVGCAEGQRVPLLTPDLRAKLAPDGLQFIQENGGKPHDPIIVQKATKEVVEFCRVLEHEGITVKRPESIRWDELGTFKTPHFTEGGYMNAYPRDGLMIVEDEIIQAPMSWRSRVFEFYPYKKLLNKYFQQGSRWTAAPRPAMGDDLYIKDFPFNDNVAREDLLEKGQFILTEAEPSFDAADAMRFGRDIFMSLSHCTNRSGVEWLRRHLKPRGIQVHSLVYKDLLAAHADTTFLPLRPGLLLVNPVRPCLLINDKPTGWEYFSRRGWNVIMAPAPVTLQNMVYVSKWASLNVLSLDQERVIMQKGEEPLRQLFLKHGLKPIEVDMHNAFELGGAFHCWTSDIRRIGKLQSYF